MFRISWFGRLGCLIAAGWGFVVGYRPVGINGMNMTGSSSVWDRYRVIGAAKGGWLFSVLVFIIRVGNLRPSILCWLVHQFEVHPLYQLLYAITGGDFRSIRIIGAVIVPPWFAGVAALIENLF